MDEREAEQRARRFVGEINPRSLPVDVTAYAAAVGAVVKEDRDLPPGESGSCFHLKGKPIIVVNANETPARRRFTVCHEIAHLVLGLPTEHGVASFGSSIRRTPNEIACDVFAAELLVPASLALALVRKSDPGLDAIDELAIAAQASFPCTGSRFAAFADYPCAFVFSEAGTVRYAIASMPLRQAKGWVDRNRPFSVGTLSARLRAGEAYEGPSTVAADLWLNDWQDGGTITEDARHYAERDQTFALIWSEGEELPTPTLNRFGSVVRDDDLKELDGVLPWPGKSRRK